MLDLRPNCELCDKDLPPAATDACICSYECTFCADCVANVLNNVCPNCGGGFSPRPIRPVGEWRKGDSLAISPASTRRIARLSPLRHSPTGRKGDSLAISPASTRRRHAKFSAEDIRAFSATIAHIPPDKR